MFVPDWLARREQLSPNKVALVDTQANGREITYRAWNRAVNRSAHFLRERAGVQKGERVAVLAHNSVAYLDLWFACGKLGAVFQPLNTRLGAREIEALVRDAGPSVLVYGAEFVDLARALLEGGRAPSIRHCIALDEGARVEEGDMAFAERDDFSDAPPPAVSLTEDDPFVLCATGGSTGLPKSAVLTHGNILWNAVNTIVSWGLGPGDTAILNAPLFHTGGLNVFTAPLVHMGGTSIVCRSFDVDQVYDLIDTGRVTLFFGVPTMFIALQEHARWARADFSRLRLVISGGAPCPLPVFERFWERRVDFKTGYGLTEAGPNTFWLPPEDVRRKPGSVGVPLFHVDVEIRSSEGRVCGPEEVGELYVRGPHVCKGYWNRPEESAKAIVDGWLRTGDLARRDEEGFYYIVGREKDMFISGGENVYPAEVESVIAGHPAVAEVAVIGVPDAKWGEVGRAVVVLREGMEAGEGEIIDFCRERLARYKAPRSVVFVGALPRTGANKVDKTRLKALYG